MTYSSCCGKEKYSIETDKRESVDCTQNYANNSPRNNYNYTSGSGSDTSTQYMRTPTAGKYTPVRLM